MEAAAAANDVSQVKVKCSDNQDEQLDDCIAAQPEKDEDQEEQERMEAFELSSGTKDYGKAAS
jgi:hypothetical protein